MVEFSLDSCDRPHALAGQQAEGVATAMACPCHSALVTAAAAGLLAWAVSACGSRDLDALFEGPVQVVEPSAAQFLVAPHYDLTEYADYEEMSFFADHSDPLSHGSTEEDPEWVPVAARGILDATLSHAQKEGDDDLPSAALYLLSPTVYRERRPSEELRVTYPPDGAAFPPGFCGMRVDWEDPTNDVWQVTVGIEGSSELWTDTTERHYWWFPRDVWREVCQRAAAGRAWIQVKGTRQTKDGSPRAPIQASPRICFRISKWPADNVIVYRLVTPPFNTRKTPHTYYRDIRSFEERPFLLSRNKYCFNCHSFSHKSGTSGKLSVQARYMLPGADLPVYFGIYDLDRQRGRRVSLPFEIQMSTFMSWSPDGRYLALAANQQVVAFSPITFETQSIAEPTSDLAICDVEHSIAYLLPGAARPDRLEMLPRWSLDGRRIVYCATSPGEHPARTRYDLHEIPFNGGEGGVPRAIPGASQNGRSNYYPRFSPDGRWLSFCQADAGLLIKASSDIYVLPADLDGAARRLESNVDYAADSWHSWSSNGHWLVFASKRDDGIFARLYLTEIDDGGHASPAVRLPLRDEPLASFNIPEFVAEAPRVTESALFEAVRVGREPQVVSEAVRGR